MTVPFKLGHLTPGKVRAWLEKMPPGDYTVGRGADPRGKDPETTPVKRSKPARKRLKPRTIPVAAE